MGDEPYCALLPWIVFTVVARANGDGVVWACFAAVVTACALLAATRRHGSGARNTLMLYVIATFSIFGVVGWFFDNPNSWLSEYARAVGAAIYAAIFLVSLAFTPVVEHYTRLNVRQSVWRDRRFTHVNAAISLVWAAAFAAIAGSMTLGPKIGSAPAFTTFNWVIPIGILTVAAHWTRVCWENFLDDEIDERINRDPLWDLAVDWHATSSVRDR
jgi:hypothetical protein